MVANILTRIVLLCINHLFAHKCFQILQFNINSFISTQLNGFKRRYVTLTIQFRYTVKKFQVLQVNNNNSIQHSFQVLLCITNNSIKHQSFVYTQLNVKTVLFLTIQFSKSLSLLVKISNSLIWSLSVATIPGQSGSGSNGIKGVLRIPPNSTPSDCSVSYPGHTSLVGRRAYPFAEKQPVYSTGFSSPADWAGFALKVGSQCGFERYRFKWG